MNRLILLIFCLLAFDEPEEAVATHKNYVDTIESYKSIGNKIFDRKYWEEIEAIDKKTNETKSFAKFSPIEKSTFIMVLGQSINHESGKLQKAWEHELNKKFSKKSETLAQRDDVVKYSQELLKFRKEFASKYEDFVGKMLSEFKDQITDDERKIILKKMIEFHDQQKLTRGKD